MTLSDRVAALKRADIRLDVLVEIALFEPGEDCISIQPNNAGTKVIYKEIDGIEVTSWPSDWTASDQRKATTAALRARGL